MILVAVAGGHPNAVLAEFGVTAGRRMTETAIRRVPDCSHQEDQRSGWGFMLIAKYGNKRSVVTLAKGVPLIGGGIGGGSTQASPKRSALSPSDRSQSSMPGDPANH